MWEAKTHPMPPYGCAMVSYVRRDVQDPLLTLSGTRMSSITIAHTSRPLFAFKYCCIADACDKNMPCAIHSYPVHRGSRPGVFVVKNGEHVRKGGKEQRVCVCVSERKRDKESEKDCAHTRQQKKEMPRPAAGAGEGGIRMSRLTTMNVSDVW
jgi:hypothetical protein